MQNAKSSDVEIQGPIKNIVGKLKHDHPTLTDATAALVEAYRVITDVFERGGILYICGNGGSFADAVHIKGELAKSFERPRPITDERLIARLRQTDDGKLLLNNLEAALPVIVLGESHSLRSAFENDRDPVFTYAQELNAFAAHIKSGCLLGISTSGNARNVIAAMTLARAYQLPTISFTGPAGGRLAELADVDCRTSGQTTPLIQENHVILYHALCRMIETHFFA